MLSRSSTKLSSRHGTFTVLVRSKAKQTNACFLGVSIEKLITYLYYFQISTTLLRNLKTRVHLQILVIEN
jgi:hypothetical protein